MFSSLGLTRHKLHSDVRRSQFSEYLPLLLCNRSEERDILLNQDNTIGYAWEITPLPFIGDKSTSALEHILNIEFPKGTVLQFLLHADENIEPILREYLNNKTIDDDLIQRSVTKYAEYLRSENDGLEKMNDVPLRNYRSFVFLKCPTELSDSILSNVEESLNGAQLSPQRMKLETLMAWFQQMLNGEPVNPLDVHVDPIAHLNSQIINADSEIDFSDGNAVVGGNHVAVVTPKSLGKSIDSLAFNRMFGGYATALEDQSQIVSPYIFSMNIIFDNVKNQVHAKANVVMSQKFGGTFAAALQKRIQEFMKVTSQLDDGKRYLKIIPSMIVYDKKKDNLNKSVARIGGNWGADPEGASWKLQEEDKIAKIIYISSLPFGLYHIDKNVDMLDRDFINTTDAIARMLPVQGEYKGTIKNAVGLYVGRKGQLCGLNVADTNTSLNFLVSASSGSGKSFFINKLLQDERGAKSKIRVLDVGGSYKKLAMTNNGRYIDFESEPICINPLDFRVPLKDDGSIDQEDFDKSRDMAVIVISEMVYSASEQTMTELEWSLIKLAADWALTSKRHEMGIDAIIEYCQWLDKYNPEMAANESIKNLASAISINLYDFSSSGSYGKYFCGKSNFDISTDEFVILELERIKGRRELITVVLMQMLNLVTADLYLGDRSTKTFVLFEEVASLLKKQGRVDLSNLAQIIEEGYRRARKYKGSFGCVLQSLTDLASFGDIGEVMIENAAYKFLLQGSTYRKAADQKIVDYSGLALDLVDSVQNMKPRYSEIFIDGPRGQGVMRLVIDKWNAVVCSSEPSDTERFEKALSSGKTPLEAVSDISGIPV